MADGGAGAAGGAAHGLSNDMIQKLTRMTVAGGRRRQGLPPNENLEFAEYAEPESAGYRSKKTASHLLLLTRNLRDIVRGGRIQAASESGEEESGEESDEESEDEEQESEGGPGGREADDTDQMDLYIITPLKQRDVA